MTVNTAKTYALAELLLRRKELQGKVDVLKHIQATALFEVKGKRAKVTEEIDDIVLQVPKLNASQVTAEYDWHARQLRTVDAAIQQANWSTQVACDPVTMTDYPVPELVQKAGKAAK